MRPIVIGALVAAACTEEIPTAPNFQTEVMPIVAASCIRCHSLPQIGGAPAACNTPISGPRTCGFRLDSFDDTVVFEGDPTTTDDDVVVLGLASIAPAIPPRINATTDTMPPRFPLDERARAILTAWAQGDPPTRVVRADNRPPRLTATVTGDVTVAIALELTDDDGDLVVGALRARGPTGDVLIAPIRSGRVTVTWPRPTTAGSYPLVAVVDDGAGDVELAVATVEVAP